MFQWIKLISILEIIGGVVGNLFIVYFVVISGFDVNVLLIAPVAFAIYTLSLVAGIYLWKGKSIGRKLSIITQFIQLPKIISPLIVFTFCFGLDIYPYLMFRNGFSTVGLEFKLLAYNELYIDVANAPYGLGVSIMAIIFLLLLYRYNPPAPQPPEPEIEMPPRPDEYPDIDGIQA
jgi:hypothetical protein